jgi:TPR repeat protein
MSTTTIPSLPPLYFLTTAASAAVEEEEFSRSDQKNSSSSNALDGLPAETLQHCLTAYADWGDLAKVANLQKSFSTVLRDAAAYGGHDSKWSLACSLLDGTHGLQTNPRLAIEYLIDLTGVTLGADADEAQVRGTECFAPAARKLATCYLNGNGVAQDNDRGIQWLKVAYAAGADLDAAYELGTIYEYGHHDVEIDVKTAAEYFLKAAKGGHTEGMAEYALCCELGCGVEQCDEEALEWYTKAAEAGHVTAKYSVGEIFEEARGVPQSDSEACLWYFKAAVDGCTDSKKALKRLHDIARIVLPGWEGQLNA